MQTTELLVEEYPAAQNIGFLSDWINEFHFAATHIWISRAILG